MMKLVGGSLLEDFVGGFRSSRLQSHPPGRLTVVTHSLTVQCFPIRLPPMSSVVEILGELWELPDPALADRWARCIRPGAVGRQLPGPAIPYYWTSAATVASIEARAGKWLMFHAAGVSSDDGAVVALIGPSGTGKSTAARTICRDEFGYVTDETVAVRTDESVVPFPKPIAVIPDDGGIKVEFGPDELGLRPCGDDLGMAGVALLERRADVAEAAVEVMGLLEGLIALVPHMSALPHVPCALSRLATVVERCGGVHKVTYRESHQLSEVVRRVLAAPSRRSGFHRHAPAEVRDEPGVQRSEHHDALELDGDVLVLKGSSCVLLQGVGSLAWLAADQPRSLSEICEAVVEAAGDHPDAERLVQEAVGELVSLGVLVSH